MQRITQYLLSGILITSLTACSLAQPPASELATGRWTTLEGREIVLIDLPHGLFQVYAIVRLTPVLTHSASTLSIEKDSPNEVTIAYQIDGEQKKLIVRIFWDQSHERFNIGLVNIMTGRIKQLRFVSDSPTLEG